MIKMNESTDEEIKAIYQKDREEGFRLLYCKYAEKLLAVCRLYSTDEGDAMDSLHESMLKANGKMTTYHCEGEGSLFKWLSRIAVNHMIDRIRKSKRLSFIDLSSTMDYPQSEPDEASIIPVEEMYKMIGSLTPARRLVFNLYYIERYSRNEIAERLGITPDGVSATLWKARKDLSKMIVEYYKRNEL